MMQETINDMFNTARGAVSGTWAPEIPLPKPKQRS